MVQAKENRERRKAETQNRNQALSEEPLQIVERTTVKWPEENTMQVFNKHNCDLGSRGGEQCDVQCLWHPHPHHVLQCPANETHFRVQQESLSKPHTCPLWHCWSWGTAGLTVGPWKIMGSCSSPSPRSPTWEIPQDSPLLFDVCAQWLRDTESKGHGKVSDVSSHQMCSFAVKVLFLLQAEQGAAQNDLFSSSCSKQKALPELKSSEN